jgi:hypothetical protein
MRRSRSSRRAGQIVFSPRAGDASCEAYFGFVDANSVPPPYGSGSITLYDSSQNRFTATYTPTSFVVLKDETCTYSFGGPKLNAQSGESMYKMMLSSPMEGSSCPARSDPCHQSYWVTATKGGILAFVDGASAACAAFFAAVDKGDEAQGSFAIRGVALERETSWVPAGYSGTYSATAGSLKVVINIPGCAATYTLDPASVMAGSSPAATISPGSAILDFVGTSSPSCPINCVSHGYNAAWDATGAARPRACCADPNAYIALSTEENESA